MDNHIRQSHRLKGYLFGASAAISYGLNPTFALPLYADGMNPDSVLLLRYSFAIVTMAVMIPAAGQSFKVPAKSLPALILLGLLMSFSSLSLFLSYNYMAAGIASTILFVYPIMVAVLMSVFCKERFGLSTVLCLTVSTGGILLLYWTGDGTTLSLTGTLTVISSALSYALYLVLVRAGSTESIHPLTLTFWVLCFGSLLFIARLLCGQRLTLPSEWYLWLDALALAVFPTAVSLLCTAAAISIIGSTSTAILGALEPVTAVIMGIALFNEGMTLREALGIAMVLLAVIWRATRSPS